MAVVIRHDRLTEPRRDPSIERNVQLLVLVVEPRDDDVRFPQVNLAAHRIDATTAVIAPKLVLLATEDLYPDVVAQAVSRDRSAERDWQVVRRNTSSDLIAPASMYLASKIDTPQTITDIGLPWRQPLGRNQAM